ncbi:MAG: 50S ribosomal protein L3 N(5)-glutamine methyltransferase [Gammaproteobacteria bacterium]|nr:50S ribosomal protein L3 N(5)-glutamine methyltransferase [Gammaproteobacteria bacterium]
MKKTPPRTVHDFILWAARLFDNADLYFGHGTDNVQDEAAWLVGSALKISPSKLDACLKDELSLEQQNTLHALVDARITTRKPLAYLINEAWFAGLKFYVDERVIVPRSLTAEFITEQFQPWVKPAQVHRILDLCTGSGCMAIALAQAFPQARVDAADISLDALAVARINVENYGLRERVRLLRSDLFSALKSERYDLIVTNPPYAANDEMKMLPPEYRHEPALALASGERGLDTITTILAQVPKHLNANGVLVAEVGNSAITLQQDFPTVPFMWLSTSAGDESVFLLTAEQLQHHHSALARAP